MIEHIKTNGLTKEKFEAIPKKTLHSLFRKVIIDGKELIVGATTCYEAARSVLDDWSQLFKILIPTNCDKK